MRRLVSTALFMLLSLCGNYSSAETPGEDQVSPRDYTILYTGRLLGYARIPSVQVLNRQDQTPEPNGVAVAYEQLIQDARRTNTTQQMLLLGMGDNFAPRLKSRIAQFERPGYPQPPGAEDCLPPGANRVPKDRVFFADYRHNGQSYKQWVCWQSVDDQNQPLDRVDIADDNVADFLIAAGYNAVVPGKHDFYFGSERLQKLATYLKTGNVAMLGANLVISTARAPGFNNTDHPRIPDAYAGSQHPNINADFGPTSLKLPKMVLPWERRFAVSNARRELPGNPTKVVPLLDERVVPGNAKSGAWICWGSEPDPATRKRPDPWQIALPDANQGNCYPLKVFEKPEKKTAAEKKLCAPKQKESSDTDVTFIFQNGAAHLHAGKNHLFCTHLLPQEASARPTDKWTCQPFAVQAPLFGAPDDKPYVVLCPHTNGRSVECKAATSTQRVAVFGVVDPDLTGNVGLLNYSWLNQDHSLNTFVAAADVKDALKQALDRCNDDPSCTDAPKVLMAQMSPARASALISSFNTTFDAVLSQADAELRTRNVNLAETGMCCIKDADGPQFVLTPPVAVEIGANSEVYRPQLSSAHIQAHPQPSPAAEDRSADRTFEWLLTNQIHLGNPASDEESAAVDHARAKPEQDCTASSARRPGLVTLAELSHDALCHQHIQSPADQTPHPVVTQETASDPVQQLALTAMRKYYRTDIAFLQKRDFYAAEKLSADSIRKTDVQDQIDRILWKSDFVTVLHVTGATLKKLVKQSEAFQERDDNALSTEIEKGRALVMLGLFNDPADTGTFYVNGVRMNDTTLYSVAATDYLAAGDTGYSDLATPDVPPAPRVEDFNDLRTVSGLMCEQMHAIDNEISHCDSKSVQLAYFDPSRNKPFDDTAGFDTAQHYLTSIARVVHRPDLPIAGAERAAQQRNFWSLDLNNLDFTFSGTFINRLKNVQSNFAGVSATGVTTAGSTSYGADHNARLTFDFGTGTLYWLTDSAFSRSTATTPLNQGWSPPSIAQNYWGFEEGGTLRFPWHPGRERPFWLALEYAVRYEPEIIQPAPSQIVYMAPTPPPPITPSNTTLFLETPKSETLYGRVGLRGDHDDTFVEAGLEYADFRHVLSQYQFAGGLACKPSASQQFVCGPDGIAITSEASLFALDAHPSAAATTSYLDPGIYLNFNIKFPILSRIDTLSQDQSWYFILTNKGNFFFNSRADTSVQTRYLNKLSPSFNIPIYGNLMLTPRMDVILFEDKSVGKHYVALQPSLSLSYSFHWRQGLGWRRTLGYGAISTKPPVSIPPP